MNSHYSPQSASSVELMASVFVGFVDALGWDHPQSWYMLIVLEALKRGGVE